MNKSTLLKALLILALNLVIIGLIASASFLVVALYVLILLYLSRKEIVSALLFLLVSGYLMIETMGRGTYGEFFSYINLAVIELLFILLFYNTYSLSKQYIKLESITALTVALSVAFMGLASILYDLIYAFEEFKLVHDYILSLGLNLHLLISLSLFMGVGLFFYFLYRLFTPPYHQSYKSVKT